MRNAFADEITRIASTNEQLILLSGDIGNRLFDDFKNAFPNRFLNCGVAEANMTGVAAGLSMNGLRPITYTITPFATTRCLEQIRDDICYHNLPAIIVGIGSGLGYAELGATHQSLEDIANLRALPNMTVLCPADPQETRLALQAALEVDGPVYLRLGKKGEQPVHKEGTGYRIGQAMPLREGDDCALLSTGTIAPLALEVADLLADQKIATNVIHFPSVKPLDNETLLHCVRKFRLIATVEEHSRIGGFGSAVAERLSDFGASTTTLLRYGTQDEFLHEAGGTAYARERHGLSAKQICDDISAYLRRPKRNVG